VKPAAAAASAVSPVADDRHRRIAAIRAGDRAVVARAITAIENGLPAAKPLLAALAGDLGRAHIVGITGTPGAGKSTLINALLRAYTERGRRTAVVAVDPSSPISGGAVLGDRIRMNDAAAADAVFIRSLASRGHWGGVSHTTRQVVDLLDAAGFDPIIVETVGAGQAEVEISSLADTSVVVCPPGLGDDVQTLKAGILEIADVLIVNKGDLPHADRAVRELNEMLQLRVRSARRTVPVLRTVATSGEGVAALVDAISAHAGEAGVGRRLRRLAAARTAPAAMPQDPRERVRELAKRDAFLIHNRIEWVDSAGGTATLRMHVTAEHLNFNGNCHGGAIFTLADSAFGLAANSHGTLAAGIDAHITYHVAVQKGDILTARATEIARNTKLAVYRIDVTRADGVAVSAMTGTVFVKSGPE
jgi:LAO/AO transport system ATPase/phenylacetic acid degradation protein PaaD